MIRRQARETVLQVLFQLDMSEQSEPQKILDQWAAEFGLSPASLEFARELLLGTLAYKAEIDLLLSRLSEGWALDRMANVDRNILRLAAYEILQRPDIPARVSLNEGIELAKRFSGEEAAKFVNGILDKLFAESPKGIAFGKKVSSIEKKPGKGHKVDEQKVKQHRVKEHRLTGPKKENKADEGPSQE